MIKLNSGRHFVKPYQSSYATARQFLIANPGIPYSTIEKYLRDLKVEGGSTLNRMCHLQEIGKVYSAESINKQCPECAWDIFHSSFFSYNWLTKCPIHGCELVNHCPSCKLLWPDINNIVTRICAHCGLPRIKELQMSALKPIDIKKYRYVKLLKRFFEKQEGHSASIWGGRIFKNEFHSSYTLAFKKYPHTSNFFPLFQASYQDNLTKDQYSKLPLTWHYLKEMTTELYLCDKVTTIHFLDKRDYKTLDESNLQDWMYKLEHTVFNRILSWIHCHTPPAHSVKLRTYRHIHLQHFDSGHSFCPYCYSLSLWFYLINVIKYGEHYHIDDRDFPIMRLSMFPDLIIPCQPVINMYRENYTTSEDFSHWFYEYCLELCFIQIFDFSLRFKKWILYFHSNGGKVISTNGWEGNIEALSYLSYIKNNKFYFFFRYANPVNSYEHDSRGLSDGCVDFNEYYESLIRNSRARDIFFQIQDQSFPETKMKTMRSEFKEFLTNNFSKWAEGHCPYHLSRSSYY